MPNSLMRLFQGKFIRIHFNQAGKLSGADMEARISKFPHV